MCVCGAALPPRPCLAPPALFVGRARPPVHSGASLFFCRDEADRIRPPSRARGMFAPLATWPPKSTRLRVPHLRGIWQGFFWVFRGNVFRDFFARSPRPGGRHPRRLGMGARGQAPRGGQSPKGGGEGDSTRGSCSLYPASRRSPTAEPARPKARLTGRAFRRSAQPRPRSSRQLVASSSSIAPRSRSGFRTWTPWLERCARRPRPASALGRGRDRIQRETVAPLDAAPRVVRFWAASSRAPDRRRARPRPRGAASSRVRRLGYFASSSDFPTSQSSEIWRK